MYYSGYINCMEVVITFTTDYRYINIKQRLEINTFCQIIKFLKLILQVGRKSIGYDFHFFVCFFFKGHFIKKICSPRMEK